MGTSHRKQPVRDLVAGVQSRLIELYRPPDGYEVVLGNGGATLFWDAAVFCLIAERSAHGVFGEFGAKFAHAAARAPFLEPPAIAEAPPGRVALPDADADADVHAWTHNETSTGALAPVRRLADGPLVLIDATSAAGGLPVDLSQTDAYYFAPQKHLASDGGLWLAFCSPAALSRAERLAAGRWIPDTLNLAVAARNSRAHQTLNTPALATLLLMDDQLRWLLANGGLEFAEGRCRESSGLLYDWAQAHPHASCSVADPTDRSPAVVTIDFDDAIDAAELCRIMRAAGVVDIEPYRGLASNQIRVGVYASVDPDDVRALIACLDHVVEALLNA